MPPSLELDVEVQRALSWTEDGCITPADRDARSKNPDMIFFEFIYSTKETTEFRFGCRVRVKDLFGTLSDSEPLTLRAHNNNTIMDPNGTYRFPKVFHVHVRLLGARDEVPKLGALTPVSDVLDSTGGILSASENVACWIIDFLCHSLCQTATPFKNIRTFVRQPFLSPFFTDLPELWRHCGSVWSPVVPLYMFLNALIVNNFTKQDILERFALLEGVESGPLMRVVRDTLLGFTMCRIEGKYYGDKWMGQSGDDQPFVNGMHDDETFFSRDDCEGRLQQGRMVLQALCALLFFTAEEVLMRVQADPAYRLLKDVGEDLLRGLIKCAHTIGWMFKHDVLKLYMVVGEACFQSFPNDGIAHERKLTGHSFGILVLDPDAKIPAEEMSPMTPSAWRKRVLERRMHIVEATGWMDEFRSPKQSQYSAAYQSIFAQNTALTGANKPTMRSCTTSEQCDDMYCIVYMMDDKLVFSMRKNGEWQYGATPSDILCGTLHLLTPLEVIEACQLGMRYVEREERIPDNVVRQVYKACNADSRATRVMSPPTLSDVHRDAQMVKQACADIKWHIHPPPDTSAEMTKRLLRWHPLCDACVPDDDTRSQTIVVFTMQAKDQKIPVWQGQQVQHSLETYPFMRSHMYVIKENPLTRLQ